MRRSHTDSTRSPAKAQAGKFLPRTTLTCYSNRNGRRKNQFPESLALDSHALCGGRAAVCAGHVGVGGALQNLGISNAAIAFYTSWLYLPWVIKPAVESDRGPAQNPAAMDLGDATAPGWRAGRRGADDSRAALFPAHARVFLAAAFSSATHDIAADGFYMLALPEHDQAFFSGIRSTFYRVAMICGQGGLVILAGKIHASTGSFARAWSMAFALGAGIFLCLGVYHRLVLPRPAFDQPRIAGPARNFFAEFFKNVRHVFPKAKNRRASAFFGCSTASAKRNW